jgi:hypothetical protein
MPKMVLGHSISTPMSEEEALEWILAAFHYE